MYQFSRNIKIRNEEEYYLYLAIFWMRESVDDWIIKSRCLCTKNGKFRDEWIDKSGIVPSSHHGNGCERSPGKDPKANVDDGDFGCTNLGRNCFLFRITTEGRDVHLFCLLTQFVFVFKNGFNNEEIRADDNDDIETILEPARRQDVTLVIPIGRKVVKRTTK